MLTLSHRFLHCHTDFPYCDSENELHNMGLKNKITFVPGGHSIKIISELSVLGQFPCKPEI